MALTAEAQVFLVRQMLEAPLREGAEPAHPAAAREAESLVRAVWGFDASPCGSAAEVVFDKFRPGISGRPLE